MPLLINKIDKGIFFWNVFEATFSLSFITLLICFTSIGNYLSPRNLKNNFKLQQNRFEMGNNYNVDALTVIINALKDLDQDSQIRTLNAVSTFFGLNSNITDVRYNIEPDTKEQKRLDNSFSEDRQISPKDFLRDKMPSTDVERIACLAYYLTHYKNIPHFKTLDLSSLNIEAAQPKFSNAAQAVDNAAKAGYLVQALKGSKQLSSIGEIFVQNLPNREAAREAVNSLKSRKRTKKALKKKQ